MVVKLAILGHEMAKNTPLPIDDTPPFNVNEERYLDLWEENLRLLAANGPVQKKQNKDG